MSQRIISEKVIEFKNTYERLVATYEDATLADERNELYSKCYTLYTKCKTVRKYYSYNENHSKQSRYYSRFTQIRHIIIVDEIAETRPADYPDTYECDVPKFGGLYLLGTICYDDRARELTFWVKPGLSKDLPSRMKGYDTCSPLYYQFDFLQINDPTDRTVCEQVCHRQMWKVALNGCAHNDEWFRVSENLYYEIKNQGFKYFNLDSMMQ